MTVHCSKFDLPDIIDEFMAHVIWFRETFRERFFRPEVETYEQFKKGLIEEAIGKSIRTDVIDTLLREMERRYTELMRHPEPEQLPENPDSGPNPKPNPTSSGASKSIPGANTGKGKKQKRSRKKRREKSLAPQNHLGRKKGQGNLTPNEFPSAIRLHIKFGSDFGAGSCCPHCNDGKLEATRSPNLLRFRGQCPIRSSSSHCGPCALSHLQSRV